LGYSKSNSVVMQSTKKSKHFSICHVTLDNLFAGLGAKQGYFEIKLVKSTENSFG